MCLEEYQNTLKYNQLHWISRKKWFGTLDFVKSRVTDGRFNNSRFVQDRYSCLLEFHINDNYLEYFDKCGNREFMLDRRKSQMVKIDRIDEIKL